MRVVSGTLQDGAVRVDEAIASKGAVPVLVIVLDEPVNPSRRRSRRPIRAEKAFGMWADRAGAIDSASFASALRQASEQRTDAR